MRSILRCCSALLIFTILPLSSCKSQVRPGTPQITAVADTQLPLGIFTTTVTGSGFTDKSTAKINNSPLFVAFKDGVLTVSGFDPQPGMAKITVSNGTITSAPFSVRVGVENAKASPSAARRLLEQAAFGSSPKDALHVQELGIPGWLNEQFDMPQISKYSDIKGKMPAHFLTMAVHNEDQLRQRVGFALSQIWVTSESKLGGNVYMIPFQNMLMGEAFSNYRQIMEDVTLSPAMGFYLDMANNDKANPSIHSSANENYARELMQLFTLGTNLLNEDGTFKLDSSGLPIPTYSQFQVTEFARVYTGWTYQPPPGMPVKWRAEPPEYAAQMVPYPPEHDSGAKHLLNNYVSPAKLTPKQDLDNALDNVFNHPNLGPFVGRMLIQHLVKSNPSPAYISRVAAAFNNNGKNVRGDMRAVITAILLDPEARANDDGGKVQSNDGHLQEPVLFISGVVRALDGHMNDENYYPNGLGELGQLVYFSPSVFNYYAADYAIPDTPLMGGEFQINTPNSAIARANVIGYLLFNHATGPVQYEGPGTSVNLAPFVQLGSNPPALVDALDFTFTHGAMPAKMKTALATAIEADHAGNLHRVQTGCYIVLTSSFYNIWH